MSPLRVALFSANGALRSQRVSAEAKQWGKLRNRQFARLHRDRSAGEISAENCSHQMMTLWNFAKSRPAGMA